MRQFLAVILISCVASAASAQALWTSAQMKAKVCRGLKAEAGVEFRTSDKLEQAERWALSAGADYKVAKWLKAQALYTYIRQQTELEVTKKGNIIPPYWINKHRLSASLTGSLKLGKVTLSLRERYQFTHRPETLLPKFSSTGKQKEDEVLEAKNKSVLRSRLMAEWRVNKHWEPFASAEVYNGWSLQKSRWTLGTTYNICKRHSVEAFYRYVSDKDDGGLSVIGVGYGVKF